MNIVGAVARISVRLVEVTKVRGAVLGTKALVVLATRAATARVFKRIIDIWKRVQTIDNLQRSYCRILYFS